VDSNAPQALPALQEAAFVKAHERSDFEGTAERQFGHHLLHQVTYDTLLKAERKLGHGAVARWLAERTQGRGSEFLAMTGEHAERAGDAALAADCFEQAGREAQKRFANTAAVAWLRRALALLGESDPARRFDLLVLLDSLADTLGDRSAQDGLHVDMATLLQHHPDDARQARLLWGAALLADRRGDAATAEQLARQTFDLAQGCGAAQWAAMAQGQLAWLHLARQDYAGASRHIETGLPWAAKIEPAPRRAETEAQLLTLSGMVSLQLCRMDEARRTLTAVLSRGESLGIPRLQLGALDNLALVACSLARWDETVALGERIRVLATVIGSPSQVAWGQHRLAEAAEALGDAAAATRWHGQNLLIYRATANRRMEACTLRFLARLHLGQGDAQTAQQCCAQSQTLHQALDEVRESCDVDAIAALCTLRLGQPAQALAMLNAALGRLQHELAEVPANETLDTRWTCHEVLVALGDARAGPLLEQLFTDVQARATQVTDATDHGRLIQAMPNFRSIVAAYRRRSAPAAGY
jgi:tetratricopeptide (TPR) repeat protein